MIQRMLTSAVLAGGAVGLLAALLHFAFVQEYILLGEQYETGAITHFASGSGGGDPAAHDHGGAAADAPHDHTPAGALAGAAAGQEPGQGLARNGLTVVFTVLVYAAYALILVAGFALAEAAGARIGAAAGLLWGVAGFAAFQLAPAMGLAPELPGTVAAELGARQMWWWSTVAATAAGLALLGYGRAVWAVPVAVLLLAAPHVIGAPQPEAFHGVAPAEVGAMFAARVLGVGLVVWAALGWAAGRLWQRGRAV